MRNKPTPVPSLASATLPSSSKHVSRHIDLRGPAAPARFEPINLEEEPAPDPPLPPPPPVSDATSPSTPAFLSKLRSLITALPSSVPIATADGPLASFAADPASFDDPSLASEDLWEEVLNTTMKAGLGWGTELNAGGLIQRGEWGMDGLLRFVEYFVTTRGVPVGLFEGKLDRLVSEMEKLQSAYSPPTNEGVPVALSTVSMPEKGKGREVVAEAEEAKDGVDSDIEIIPAFTPTEPASATRIACVGYEVIVPAGKSPYGVYPLRLHSEQKLPWDCSFQRDRLFLTSHQCKKRAMVAGVPCKPCASLMGSPVVKGIEERMRTTPHPSTPYAYLGMDNLVDALRTKNTQIQSLRLSGMNHVRQLLRNTAAISDHKRLVVAIGEGSVARVDRVIHAALKKKRGVLGILEQVVSAAKGVYSVKSFTDRERSLGKLLWRLGGDRVGHIAHRALGLPSVSTLRNGSVKVPITPSAGKPTVATVAQNTLGVLDGVLGILKERTDVRHAILMFDELACEKRIRWNQRNDDLLGLCREHGPKVALKFTSAAEPEEAYKAVDKGEIHLASEATIAAMGILCPDNRLYSARPILISGDCKKETGAEHAVVLQTVLDGVNQTKATSNLRIVSLASDGEARRGAALVQLTFKNRLPEDSNIYPQLAPLSLLNLHVGVDDLTCDKDWKHVFKRFRNLLLRDRGIVIDDVRITPAITKTHLRTTDASAEHINAVFNPNDLQDVKLAFDLLRDIWALPPLPEPTSDDARPNPGFQRSREALRVLGRLLFHLVYAYLCVDLTLSEQLEHLSAAAHLAFVLYKTAGKSFIPTLLYIDIIIMIKNVFFCVAKAKVDTPDGLFFIILLGTDRIEIHFGILRTVIGNDCNLDVLQISERAGGVIDIADILATNPDWDRGPRRMNVPTLNTSSPDVPNSADHLSPSFYKDQSKMALSKVTLQTCWRRGRALAETDYPAAIEILNAAEAAGNVDMLAPNGELLVTAPLPAEDIDESSEALVMGSATQAHSSTHLNDAEADARLDIEDELEQLSRDLEVQDGIQQQTSTTPSASKIQCTLEVNGKPMAKSKILSMISRYRRTVVSGDRLKRVQDIERFQASQPDPTSTYNTDSNLLLIHDPVAALLWCDKQVWLVVGEVIGIRYDGEALESIGHNLLAEAAAKVTVQILGLRPSTSDDDPSQQNDWRTYTSPSFRSLEMNGRCIEAIDPDVPPGRSFYLLRSPFLIATTALLLERLSVSDLKSLPKVTATSEYPYRERSGRACFLGDMGDKDLTDIANANTAECAQCVPSVKLDLSQGQRVLEHIGAHILFDAKIDQAAEPCGLCLRPPHQCKWFVVKGRGSKANMRVDNERSVGCTRPISYVYGVAATSSTSSPCSNVPLRCPLCSRAEPAVWRYNLHQHIIAVHPTSSPADYSDLWTISDTERAAMKKIWSSRQPKAPKRVRKSNAPALVVSQAHISTAVTPIRYVLGPHSLRYGQR
ncbi:hypothetical protein DFP72DRAFT_823118 [Ephemerocybe angulata]|uniref:Uncharacterized protein n=1 Tax=Ephemerocybe angulata TaxID=980116 RepID=A0A8H6HHK8_9AGAR|nr:hypothetical protein DFP72DRAFT_823118 [Tulosesus angulatus]